MNTYISTSGQTPATGFCEAVIQGVAPDGGLYFPQDIPALGTGFKRELPGLTIPQIGSRVLRHFIPNTIINDGDLSRLTAEAFDFNIPLVEVEQGIYSLELFHGPTLAFKDMGARFLGRTIPYCAPHGERSVVLVATSGDTGSAVAHGMRGVKDLDVVILYPKGKVSALQEKQFASIGGNVTALAVNGVFDDCQRLVKQAFADHILNEKLNLTSANSINIARWLPQSIYYFIPRHTGLKGDLTVSVPSGNFGNITAGILAARMGMSDVRFIAACNANDIVPEYLATGHYHPRPSVQTIANAMDVGDPSNFVRLKALFANDFPALCASVQGFSLDDAQIRETIRSCFHKTGYLLDPHGAVGYAALQASLREGETGVFLATAHPAKFGEVYRDIGIATPTHERLESLRDKAVHAEDMPLDYEQFKQCLLERFADSST